MGWKSRRQRVTVYWMDSCSHQGWQDPDEERSPLGCETTGYLIKRTNKHIEVAASESESEAVGEVVVIPIENVTRVERLRGRR